MLPLLEAVAVISLCRTWAACLRHLPESDALVVSLERQDFERGLLGLSALERTSGVPVILCVPPDVEILRRLVMAKVDDLVLHGPEEKRLPELVLERCATNVFRTVAHGLCQRASDNPVLVRALHLVWEQRAPALNEARARMARGEPVFVRSVRDVSNWIGCHPDYLSRQARARGISLSASLRWLTTLRGISLYNPPWATWHDVAARLGFEDPAAWSHFVRRLTGATPSELVSRPWATIVERALEEL